MSEDQIIIDRIGHSPDRRVYYVDVGAMTPSKREEMVRYLQKNFERRQDRNGVYSVKHVRT